MSIVQCAMKMKGRATLVAPRHDGPVPHVATYRRSLPVSLERLYENALDWEHLPHVHRSSFTGLSCLDWGAWGWRAAVTDAAGRSSVIELTLDRISRRWVTRTLEGHGAGAEIWTQAYPMASRQVDIEVDFFVPALGPEPANEGRERVAAALTRLYARLYDEDVAMMCERQRQLERRVDRARDHERSVDLGPRAALQTPLSVTLGGREFVVAESAGRLLAFPAHCPHQLGPLSASALAGTVVTCPWHGYRFDVVSGDNLSGRSCRLSHLPKVSIDADSHVRLIARH